MGALFPIVFVVKIKTAITGRHDLSEYDRKDGNDQDQKLHQALEQGEQALERGKHALEKGEQAAIAIQQSDAEMSEQKKTLQQLTFEIASVRADVARFTDPSKVTASQNGRSATAEGSRASLKQKKRGALSPAPRHERPVTVIESGAIGRSAVAADETAVQVAAEILEVRANGCDRFRSQRTARATEAVEHARIELLARRLRDCRVIGARDELQEPLCLCHIARLAVGDALAHAKDWMGRPGRSEVLGCLSVFPRKRA